MGRKFRRKLKFGKKIEKFISKDEEQHEINKCVKILGKFFL